VTQRLVVGLIGCGRWGRHILRDLRSLDCEVVVVAPSSSGRDRALEGGATLVVDRIDSLPSVAGIVVATPTITHAAVIEAALGKGVPVFTEKPMTGDYESAARLAELAPARLFVMDKWRYHPGIELLARIAQSGELGPVLGLHTTRTQWGSPHDDVDCIWTLAPHDLSIALEVLGSIPPVRSAIAESVRGHPAGLYAILGDDPWMIMQVSSRYPGYRRETRLHCRDGVAVLADSYSETVQIMRNTDFFEMKPQIESRPISGEMPLLRELSAFVAHLRGGPPPRSSAAEGALIVNTIVKLRALAGIDAEQDSNA
jgi:predicted dehydrogenase